MPSTTSKYGFQSKEVSACLSLAAKTHDEITILFREAGDKLITFTAYDLTKASWMNRRR